MSSRISPEALTQLEQIVTAERLSCTEADLQQHGRDQSSLPPSYPDAVIWPTHTAEVSDIMRVASQHQFPIVGWGAGSSLEGHPIPIYGGLVVNFGQMAKILAVHRADFQVTVQPGIFYKDMNRVLARDGLFFAPDPGANASIGGMIANNAAGIRTVRYGATRDNVLALQVVLASGEVIRTGSRSVKQSAGYDLTHLFTGSEGTLGLITEATLKLAPLPEHFSAVTAVFPDVECAAEAVFHIIGAGLNPAALELLDTHAIRALATEAGFRFPHAPTLFMEFSGASTAALTEELALVREICEECTAVHFEAGLGADERKRLWAARHHMFETLVRLHPNCDWQVTDVAVPISAYPQMVAFAQKNMAQLDLDCSIVGHAGDGNMHTIAFYERGDTAVQERTTQLNERLVAQAISLGGTCTGEHGVGIGKQKYMVSEHGEVALNVMRQIKATLDPHNLLNPGKVLAL